MLETMLSNGMTGWAPYRYLEPDEATYGSIERQIDDCMTGTHNAINAGLVWPPFVALDIEMKSDRQAPSIAQIVRAMNWLEQRWDITADSQVKPVIYSSKTEWDALYPGYTEPGRRRWWGIAALWNGKADLTVPSFAGLTIIGHQYSGTHGGPFGGIDADWFEIPPAQPGPVDYPVSITLGMRSGATKAVYP